jgi:hypothetical protein
VLLEIGTVHFFSLSATQYRKLPSAARSIWAYTLDGREESVAEEGKEIESQVCRKSQKGCEEKKGEEVEALTWLSRLYFMMFQQTSINGQLPNEHHVLAILSGPTWFTEERCVVASENLWKSQ